MEIRILGAHNCESRDYRMVSILIDGIIALDAGGLTFVLSIEEQLRIKAVLLTHHHFDHSRDVVTLGFNNAMFSKSLAIFGLNKSLEIVKSVLLDGRIYADFARLPSQSNPSLTFRNVEYLVEQRLNSYRILPIPVKHSVDSTGYYVSANDGPSVFYSGDTGPGFFIKCGA